MVEKSAKALYKKIRKLMVPKHLKNNQIKLDFSQLKKIETSIRENYHQGWRSEKNYTPEAYTNDLRTHLISRLEADRASHIPWLNMAVELKGANVLEIGCGTGSSTVALAEQGANVTALDIDEGALQVAKDRCKVYNLPATFIFGNAAEIYDDLKKQTFDLIIFYACIEHMVYEERIECIKNYFNLLPRGAYLSFIETPNRLWYVDSHTSLLPFFNWLPDKAAFDYSKYSKRVNFKELYHEYSDENILHFLRQGRGFSFHEIEIALDMPAENLQVISCIRRPFMPLSLDGKFHKILKQIYPEIHKGFFYPMLDIIIRK